MVLDHTQECLACKSALLEEKPSIPEEPKLRHRYGAIEFESERAGHGCSFIMQGGRLIATYSNDWQFSKYEDDKATAPG